MWEIVKYFLFKIKIKIKEKNKKKWTDFENSINQIDLDVYK